MRPRLQSVSIIPFHTITRLPPPNLRSTLPLHAWPSPSTQLHTEIHSPPNPVFGFNPEKQLGVNQKLDHDPHDPNNDKKNVEVSDREWEIRTGKYTFIRADNI